MDRKFLVLQHNAWEVPGEYVTRNAEKNKIQLDVCRVWEETIPDPDPYDCLMVLGGGPNVGQEEIYPFLLREKEVIRKSLDDDRPYIGFCLGHQLLAESLGAKVKKNCRVSIGFVSGFLTHHGLDHPALRGMPCCMPLFKWHGYGVIEPLPRHIQVLATSRECEIEAISVVGRPHIIGLQFDNQSASPNDVAKWLIHDQEWLKSIREPQVDPREILAKAEEYSQETSCEFDMIFNNFLNIIDNKN